MFYVMRIYDGKSYWLDDSADAWGNFAEASAFVTIDAADAATECRDGDYVMHVMQVMSTR